VVQTPQRAEALRKFAARALSDDSITVEAASADASFRSYWRVKSNDGLRMGATFIVMDAPPDREDLAPWLDVAKRLRAAHLNAPEVLAEDRTQGFVLMGDLGSRTYLWELNTDTVDALYKAALDALLVMQTRADTEGLPAYDEPRLRAEMELLPEWFVARHLGTSVTADEREMLDGVFAALVASALEQPQVFVHRDYHSRNLLIASPNPGIIDFQDAVRGPVTYDLVSLLRDCYVSWPADRVYAWANAYRDRLVDKNVLKFGELRWKRWFDFMGVQRHVKVLGIFARLNYRDGKAGFLKDLPLVLKYTVEVAAKYKELKPLADWLQKRVGSRDVSQPRE
jgi:aminoglycoside/choline kinase family phosphotransferase